MSEKIYLIESETGYGDYVLTKPIKAFTTEEIAQKYISKINELLLQLKKWKQNNAFKSFESISEAEKEEANYLIKELKTLDPNLTFETDLFTRFGFTSYSISSVELVELVELEEE